MKVSSSLNYNTQWDQQMCCARIYVLSMSVLSVNLYTSRQSGHDQYISSCATHFSIPMWVHQFSNCLTLVFSPHAAAMWGGGQPRLFVLTEALDGYLGWHRPTLTTKALIFSKKEVSKVLPQPPATCGDTKGRIPSSLTVFWRCRVTYCSTAALVPASP